MKSYPNNYIYYPLNYFEPYNIMVNDTVYKMHKVRFNTLYELYEVLKSNPKTNNNFHVLSSLSGSKEFAGVSYHSAVENLIKDVDEKYHEFIRLEKNLVSAQKRKKHQFITTKTVSGGQIHIPSYSAGMPLCYETEERISKPKFIKIHSNISYSSYTTKEQVYNKAIILLNIIKIIFESHKK